ncbi:dethiobiotin synthase [Wolbachia endosymbiont of Ctenocephalides felis wCfeT]|uniref:dethiobiotin synthase n=1 Tax=Wolbachia endosymbiont of Ctenocephalides felis wCfeT TaxID=2732593 RepID=UPI001447CDDC|nr:dethiobiotin synthase [Wolbachia endosymbiont of Ctenocephalides felis wCfeT]
MQIFVTGTDTDVGKTIISSWLCLHTGYSYFKPIQTGSVLGTDSHQVSDLVSTEVYKEDFVYKEPLSPHLAASLENCSIDIDKISLPKTHELIIEGAGGILVPISRDKFIIDLIKKFNVPTILVARSVLGTINHTLLSLEALRARNISILGVILNGPPNQDNLEAIEFYGRVQVLASVPKLQRINRESLMQIPLSNQLKTIFEVKQ